MKVAALVSVVLLLAALVFIVRSNAQDELISISERAAHRRWSYLIFACSLSLFGSLLLQYLLRDFGKQFGLSPVYYAALFAAWIFLLFTAWIPDHGPRSFKNLHWKTAFGLAASMTIMTASLIFAQHIDVGIRLLSALASIWYCYTLYVWVFNTYAYQRYLRYEAMNIISFVGLFGLTLIFR